MATTELPTDSPSEPTPVGDDTELQPASQPSSQMGAAQQRQTGAAKRRTADKVATSERAFDLVIFAASSSVGKFIVEELALVVDKHYSRAPEQQQQSLLGNLFSIREDPSIQQQQLEQQQANRKHSSRRRQSVPRHVNTVRWAIAGRSAMHLTETLGRAELSTGIKGLSTRVPILLADLNHHRSLVDVCSKTSLVLNCAGPYSLDGEALIRACLESRTSYLDLSHEVTFIEQVRRFYSERARQAGVYIINGCGFQSMSAELGLNFTKQVADGRIEEVKIVLTLSDTQAKIRPSGSSARAKLCGIVSWGMWCSLLLERGQQTLSLGHTGGGGACAIPASALGAPDDPADSSASNLRRLERRDTQTLVRDIVEFRNRRSFDWFQLLMGFGGRSGQNYCLPINSLTSEESQLIRGEMNNYELRGPDLDSAEGWTPIRCTSFISVRNFGQLILTLLWILLFNVLASFSVLRSLMRYLPYISSLGHVNKSLGDQLDRDSLSHIKFSQTFMAYGTPGEHSGDPLARREKHQKRKQEQLLVARIVGPEPNHVATATYAVQAALALIIEQDLLPAGGGVLTPGVAFSETNIIYQLRRRNIKFEVLKKA